MLITKIVDEITESNCYIITDESAKDIIIIDPNDFKSIQECIGIDKRDIKVLLTHEHYDHIRGLNELRNYYKCIVISTEKCSNAIQSSIENHSKSFGVYLHFLGKDEYRKNVKEYICKPSDVVFEDFYKILENNYCINMYKAPGHSPGGCCIIINEKYLFTGDSLLWGKTIINSRGGDKKIYEEYTYSWLYKLNDSLLVYPGHGKEFLLKERKDITF